MGHCRRSPHRSLASSTEALRLLFSSVTAKLRIPSSRADPMRLPRLRIGRGFARDLAGLSGQSARRSRHSPKRSRGSLKRRCSSAAATTSPTRTGPNARRCGTRLPHLRTGWQDPQPKRPQVRAKPDPELRAGLAGPRPGLREQPDPPAAKRDADRPDRHAHDPGDGQPPRNDRVPSIARHAEACMLAILRDLFAREIIDPRRGIRSAH